MLIDAVDSYFMYVSQQIKTIDLSQTVAGLINARDWPQTPLLDGALYCLYLRAVPIGGTEQQTLFQFFLQWNWIILGTDIQAKQQAQNRGDRYRRSLKIQSTLRSANYPSFTQKMSYSVDADGLITGIPGKLIATPSAQASIPATNYEGIWWSKLRFNPRVDSAKSGVEYGSATMELYAYDDADAVVAA